MYSSQTQNHFCTEYTGKSPNFYDENASLQWNSRTPEPHQLTTSFCTGVLDCQLAIEIHIVPREKIAPFQIHSVGLKLIMFSNLIVLYSSL